MAKIKTLKQGGEILYPRTSTKAVLDDNGSTVESRLTALESSSGAVEVDTTLSVSGKAADAKATGDKVQEVAQSVTTLNTSVTNMDTRVTALESAGGGGSGGGSDYAKGVQLTDGDDTVNIVFSRIATQRVVTLTWTNDELYRGTIAQVSELTFPLTNALPYSSLIDGDQNLYHPDALTLMKDGNLLVVEAVFVDKPETDTLTYLYEGFGIFAVTAPM